MIETTMRCEESFTIRPMWQEDLEQVRAIDLLSFSMPWPESAYNYELNENPLSMLWVAEQNNITVPPIILGMIVIWLILDEAHIATIAVHPDHRQKGIARCLLAEALKGAIRRGAHEATLEVRASNIPAQRLYQSFHFQVVGERRRYYRDNNEDALIMTISGLDNKTLAWLESVDWKQKEIQHES